MHLIRKSVLITALLLSPVVQAGKEHPQTAYSSSPAMEALFAEARMNWERNLSGQERSAHLLPEAGVGSSSDTAILHDPDRVSRAPFALPRARDPFDPLGPPRPHLLGQATGIMDIPAHLYFRTGDEVPLSPELLSVPENWVSVEARNPLLGHQTLRSLRQIGFASITPIPEPALPSLAGLALIGALVHRRRPSRP